VACFKHKSRGHMPGGTEAGPNVTVFLKRDPGPRSNPRRRVSVFLWKRENCGCTTSSAKSVRFTHRAVLTVNKGFLCEGICRGTTGGVDVLYSAGATRGDLRSVARAPANSGCRGTPT
jgi:hypothetical protein